MSRIIRRAPWIALGAAGVYYLDAANGPARRRVLADAVRGLADRAGIGRAGATPDRQPSDEPLAPSIAGERVRTRASGPQAEELAAGIADPAPTVMAARILEESEWRVVDRDGTSGERRRSEDTVQVHAAP